MSHLFLLLKFSHLWMSIFWLPTSRLPLRMKRLHCLRLWNPLEVKGRDALRGGWRGAHSHQVWPDLVGVRQGQRFGKKHAAGRLRHWAVRQDLGRGRRHDLHFPAQGQDHRAAGRDKLPREGGRQHGFHNDLLQVDGHDRARVSYMTVERLADDTLEAGMDAFSLTITQDMKFKCVMGDKITCKIFCGKNPQSVKASQIIGTAFRFRFERVGMSLKAQKPYVICHSALTLQKGKPLKLSG